MNKIYIIGIGPGAYQKMTLEAIQILERVDIIIGYHVYVDLIKEYFPKKEFLTSPMRKEIERCKMALEQARKGKEIGFICSGDAGVYGLAGVLYTLLGENTDIELEVVAGVTAAISGASILGAPLIHDFVVISLSDLLTPMEKIERRLRAAAEGDFVIVLYNPSSKKRADYLARACNILLERKSPQTICAYIRNIARVGEESKIVTLEELEKIQVDMFTTVFIGNSQTKRLGDKMITPRGYEEESICILQ